jgi:hypothetical protein
MNNTEPRSAETALTPPPQQVLMQMRLGMWVAQAVATAARLGIADALAQSQPQESTTLSNWPNTAEGQRVRVPSYRGSAPLVANSRALNPSLQTFDAWLAHNANRIPLEEP